MSAPNTPPLSIESSREVLDEMSRPPKDTPERRATEERVRFMEEVRKRQGDTAPIGLER